MGTRLAFSSSGVDDVYKVSSLYLIITPEMARFSFVNSNVYVKCTVVSGGQLALPLMCEKALGLIRTRARWLQHQRCLPCCCLL